VELRRNEERVNCHIQSVLCGWRANIDITVMVDPELVARYVAKYAPKSEQTSASFADTFHTIVQKMQVLETARAQPLHNPAISSIQRLLNAHAIERDFSAQEVCWLLLQGKQPLKAFLHSHSMFFIFEFALLYRRFGPRFSSRQLPQYPPGWLPRDRPRHRKSSVGAEADSN
jgi:hypothetical protein